MVATVISSSKQMKKPFSKSQSSFAISSNIATPTEAPKDQSSNVLQGASSLLQKPFLNQRRVHSGNTLHPRLLQIPYFSRTSLSSATRPMPRALSLYNDIGQESTFPHPAPEIPEIESFWQTALFLSLKRAVSYSIFHFKILFQILVLFRERLKDHPEDRAKLANTFYDLSHLHKIQLIRKGYEKNLETEWQHLEEFLSKLKIFLNIRGHNPKNSVVLDLKDLAYSTSDFFKLTADEFNSYQNTIFNQLEEQMKKHGISLQSISARLFPLIYIVHDVIIAIYTHVNMLFPTLPYSFLNTEKEMFVWSFEFLINLFSSEFANNFRIDDNTPSVFEIDNINMVTGFILSLLKLVGAKHTNQVLSPDMFSLVSRELNRGMSTFYFDTFTNITRPLSKILMDTFLQFKSEMKINVRKLKALQDLHPAHEPGTKNECLKPYSHLDAIVESFFKRLIYNIKSTNSILFD